MALVNIVVRSLVHHGIGVGRNEADFVPELALSQTTGVRVEI